MTTHFDYDVIVVGAGFAGLVAAREFQTAGISYSIVEAKDRIGGRAWTQEAMGRPLEFGATWVHWHQPHVWSEISRYGQEIEASPTCSEGYWVSNGQQHHGTEKDLEQLLSRPQAKILSGSDYLFPEPYNPLAGLEHEEIREKLLELDKKSIIDELTGSDLTQEEIDAANGYWSSGCQGNVANSSSLMAKHWGALTDHRIELFDEQTIGYKLKNGMRGLYESIANDLHTSVRLNTAVEKIEHFSDHVVVHYRGGYAETAKEALVTAPLGALGNIEFCPKLDKKKRDLISDGWNSTGYKLWIKIAGHHKFFGLAPKPFDCSFIRSEYLMEDNSTICVAFGPDNSKVDLESVADAQRLVNQWRDDLKVLDCAGHDWTNDQWAGQTWATLKKGQFTDGWHHFLQTSTALNFAGSDWAPGWRGIVVDGALESGIKQARRILDRLQNF